jgi:hypothetical protein
MVRKEGSGQSQAVPSELKFAVIGSIDPSFWNSVNLVWPLERVSLEALKPHRSDD